MKKTSKLFPLLLQTAGLGLLGFALRLVLYRIGFDEKGILSASHPLHLACLVLVPAVTGWILFRLRAMKKRQLRLGSRGKFLKFAAGVGGILMIPHTLSLFPPAGPLPLLRALLSALCCGAMAAAAFVPKKSRWVRMVCFGLICCSFLADMICRYQSWSGNPQLPDYVFHVLACIFLSLCAYQRLALEVGLGKRKAQVFCSLMALFLCLISAAGPEPKTYYLAGALWAGAGISTAKAPAAKKLPEPAPEEITPEKEENS